ncbi:hypothetical protein Mapa_015840 [Marchantia paleacea]|nr:hypothetical protein Mapa_015840 [Marchantia paleacea]
MTTGILCGSLIPFAHNSASLSKRIGPDTCLVSSLHNGFTAIDTRHQMNIPTATSITNASAVTRPMMRPFLSSESDAPPEFSVALILRKHSDSGTFSCKPQRYGFPAKEEFG